MGDSVDKLMRGAILQTSRHNLHAYHQDDNGKLVFEDKIVSFYTRFYVEVEALDGKSLSVTRHEWVDSGRVSWSRNKTICRKMVDRLAEALGRTWKPEEEADMAELWRIIGESVREKMEEFADQGLLARPVSAEPAGEIEFFNGEELIIKRPDGALEKHFCPVLVHIETVGDPVIDEANNCVTMKLAMGFDSKAVVLIPPAEPVVEPEPDPEPEEPEVDEQAEIDEIARKLKAADDVVEATNGDVVLRLPGGAADYPDAARNHIIGLMKTISTAARRLIEAAMDL